MGERDGDDMRALGVRLGMDSHQAEITADDVYDHVLWLERRARAQGMRAVAPQVPIFGVAAAMRCADDVEAGRLDEEHDG